METRNPNNVIFSDTTTSTTTSAWMSQPTANNSTVIIASSAGLLGTKKEARAVIDIQGAVYSHIQAVRALGKKNINTEEIAKALSLPVESVNAAVAKLKDKGVRVAA
jgi:hypothetical protein